MSSKRKRLFQVLISPVISEKATEIGDRDNCYIFRVAADATKVDVKEAVQSVYKVKVTSVRTHLKKGSETRFRGHAGIGKTVKKAYVTLAGDDRLVLY